MRQIAPGIGAAKRMSGHRLTPVVFRTWQDACDLTVSVSLNLYFHRSKPTDTPPMQHETQGAIPQLLALENNFREALIGRAVHSPWSPVNLR